MRSLPSCATLSRRKPSVLAWSLLQGESFSLILNSRTSCPTHGGLSLCGKPKAKFTAASTHIWPGTGFPMPFTRPASTTRKTSFAISRFTLISVFIGSIVRLTNHPPLFPCLLGQISDRIRDGGFFPHRLQLRLQPG